MVYIKRPLLLVHQVVAARGVASGWTGWKMSRGPEGPNQNEQNNHLFGEPRRSLPMAPDGLATAVGAAGFISRYLSGPLP